MKPVHHNNQLYTVRLPDEEAGSEAALKIGRISQLLAYGRLSAAERISGRGWVSRAIDAALAGMRRYAPPIHRIGVILAATSLYIYARLVARTMRLTMVGSLEWPDRGRPCVLAVWHGSAPSLLVAIIKKNPRLPLAIMVAGDPRGDCLALLCRFLALEVVRGGSDEGGWEALIQLSHRISSGACGLITADGGGPAHTAKVGPVALSSATGARLVAVGADCRPAIVERHKWDMARNPVPFGRVAIAIGESRDCTAIDLEAIEQDRGWLETALDKASGSARNALETLNG